MKWIRAGAAAPGLARLHGRFGFNCSWFVLAAVLEVPGLEGRSAFVLNALPILFGAAIVAGGVARVRRGDASVGPFILAASAVPCGLAVVALASLSPDASVALLTFVSLALWVDALERRCSGSALLACGVAAYALTMKLSALPLVAGSGVLVLASRRWIDRRSLALLASAVLALWIPWVARGVVTSGCVAYPVGSTCLGVLPWSVARADAELASAVIARWARAPGIDPRAPLATAAWIGGWARRNVSDPIGGVALAFVAAGGVFLAAGWRDANRAVRGPLLVTLLGIVFWFATAPDPRFGAGFLLAAGLVPLAVGVSRTLTRRPPGRRRAFLRRVAILAVAATATSFLLANTWILLLRTPRRNGLLTWPAFPVSHYRELVTDSGRLLRVPVGTDRCWDAPLPCAPEPWPPRDPDWWRRAW